MSASILLLDYNLGNRVGLEEQKSDLAVHIEVSLTSGFSTSTGRLSYVARGMQLYQQRPQRSLQELAAEGKAMDAWIASVESVV